MSQSSDICLSCTSVFHFYTFVWNFWSVRSCLIFRIRNDLKQFFYVETKGTCILEWRFRYRYYVYAFQVCNCHVVISQTTSKTRTKVRVARAAPLVFLIKAIILYWFMAMSLQLCRRWLISREFDSTHVLKKKKRKQNNSNCFWIAVSLPLISLRVRIQYKTKNIRKFAILCFQSSRWLVASQQLHVCHKCWHVILSYSQE